MVRDSFSMPENDYSQFAALKRKCLLAGVHVKKSELLRAGLLCLSKLSDSELVNVVGQWKYSKQVGQLNIEWLLRCFIVPSEVSLFRQVLSHYCRVTMTSFRTLPLANLWTARNLIANGEKSVGDDKMIAILRARIY